MASSGLNFDSFFNNLGRGLEPATKTHLYNVYSCLSMTTLAAAAGGYTHLFTDFIGGGFLTFLVTVGLLVALTTTPDNGKNRTLRLGYLLGFAFFSGVNMGPLLNYAIHVDPAIIPTALMATAVIFICFSIASIFSTNRYYLYLGGTLSSGLSYLLLLGLANIFFRSYLLFQIELYLGLVVMCGFVLYDTQMIIEKHRNGDKDYIQHSLSLFVDMINIFRRLLIILTQKEQQKNKRKSN